MQSCNEKTIVVHCRRRFVYISLFLLCAFNILAVCLGFHDLSQCLCSMLHFAFMRFDGASTCQHLSHVIFSCIYKYIGHWLFAHLFVNIDVTDIAISVYFLNEIDINVHTHTHTRIYTCTTKMINCCMREHWYRKCKNCIRLLRRKCMLQLKHNLWYLYMECMVCHERWMKITHGLLTYTRTVVHTMYTIYKILPYIINIYRFENDLIKLHCIK